MYFAQGLTHLKRVTDDIDDVLDDSTDDLTVDVYSVHRSLTPHTLQVRFIPKICHGTQTRPQKLRLKAGV
mgnify:CR=1 FL=1